MRYRTRPHFVLVGIVGNIARASAIRAGGRNAGNVSCTDFIEWRTGRIGFRLNPRREEALHQRGHQLRFRVAAKLQKRFNNLRQIRNAAVLIGALAVHDVQDIRQAGALTVGRDARPFLLLGRDLVRIGVADVIGDDAAVFVDLHAVENAVTGAGPPVRNDSVHEAAVGIASAEVGRRGNTVCLNDVQSHGVWIQRRRRVTLHQDKHVSGHEPRFERELLQSHEVVQAERVAVLLFTAPESKFHLGLVLPFFCRLRRKPQQVAVDGCFQCQAGTDNLCAVGIDGARGHGRCHIKHSRPLAQRGVVAVNIFVGRTAVWGEPLERAPGDARASFAIALGIRSSAPAVISLAQCFRLL